MLMKKLLSDMTQLAPKFYGATRATVPECSAPWHCTPCPHRCRMARTPAASAERPLRRGNVKSARKYSKGKWMPGGWGVPPSIIADSYPFWIGIHSKLIRILHTALLPHLWKKMVRVSIQRRRMNPTRMPSSRDMLCLININQPIK